MSYAHSNCIVYVHFLYSYDLSLGCPASGAHGTHKQREEHMNTITINNADGASVVYTESEVLRFIERAGEVDAVQQVSNDTRKRLNDNRDKVRDFFSEVEWCDGEYTFTKSDVNELLYAIGANKLTTKYTANYTITGTFSVEVDDEDDVEVLFVDNVSVDFYDGEIDVDNIEIHDMQVDE